MRGAGIQRFGQLGDQRRQNRNRIERVLRIGGVALHAGDGERYLHGTAPADLDRVGGARGGRRLADEAVIDALAFLRKRFQNRPGAVDVDAFFVTGDEQADGAFRLALRQHALHGGDETGDGGFHIGGAASIERAAVDLRREGIMPPRFRVAHRYDVGVARETEIGGGCAKPCVKIFHCFAARRLQAHAFAGEAQRGQRALNDRDRAFVLWRHRRTTDQGLRKSDGIDHVNL